MTDQARSTSPQDDRSRGFIEFDYVPYEDTVWGPKLGSGSFGCVYRGELRCSSSLLGSIFRVTSPRIDVGLGIGSADSSLMDTRNLSRHRCRAEGDSTVYRIRCVSPLPSPPSGIERITLMPWYHSSPRQEQVLPQRTYDHARMSASQHRPLHRSMPRTPSRRTNLRKSTSCLSESPSRS